MTEPPESQTPQAQTPQAQTPQATPEAQTPERQPSPAQPAAGQSQAAEPLAGTSMDAAGVLVRALGQLPAADRDQVYTWLLGAGLHIQPTVLSSLGRGVRAELPAGRQQDFAEQGAELVRTLFRGSPSSGQQMVPVRFSTEQHARLRAWCTEHGFSMATVIRGLVERFLDGQQPERH